MDNKNLNIQQQQEPKDVLAMTPFELAEYQDTADYHRVYLVDDYLEYNDND